MVDGRLRVIARHGYPRPITCAVPRGPAMIDGSRWGGYLIEPVAGMVAAKAAPEAVAALLAERVGIARDAIGTPEPGLTYYPSPGGIDEVVQSLFVPVSAPVSARSIAAAFSGFSTAGQLREFDAQDLLRAAHVGVLPAARLEMNLYALMARLGIPPDPFIGEAIEPPAADPDPASLRGASLGALLARPGVAPFQPSAPPAQYLRLVRSVFADETDENGLPRTLAEHEFEFVLPRRRSVNTVVALPLLGASEPRIGLETRLLPVPQRHQGDARIPTAPAWRLDRDIATLAEARRFIAATLGVETGDVVPLGAAYFPSAGITPERVHPFVVRLSGSAKALPYDFVPLSEVRASLDQLRDGHLLVAALRLMHALGLVAETRSCRNVPPSA